MQKMQAMSDVNVKACGGNKVKPFVVVWEVFTRKALKLKEKDV